MTHEEWLSSNVPRAMLDALIYPSWPSQYLRTLKDEDQPKARRLDRKLRLYACACVRRAWHLLEDERSRRVVEVAERYAEGLAGPEELDAAAEPAEAVCGRLLRVGGLEAAYYGIRPEGTSPAGPVFGESKEARAFNAAQAAYNLTRRKVGDPSNSRVYESAWPAAGTAPRSASDALAEAAELRAREARLMASHESNDINPTHYEDAMQADLVRCILGRPFRPVAFEPGWIETDAVILAESIEATRDFGLMAYLGDCLEASGCENADVLAHCRGDGPHARGCWVIDAVLGRG